MHPSHLLQSDENIEKALKNIVACYENQTLGEAAEISGVHLEGPFISNVVVPSDNNCLAK
jgi:N-acetylglucosamine-6-phosphate deacetylase